MNDTLKVAGRIGAELGAAKAENEAMRILLRESYSELMVMKTEVGFRGKTLELIDRIDAFLSRQPEPTDTYTAVDMATAAAQGFRDGQEAVEPAPAQDERETPIFGDEDHVSIPRGLIGAACSAIDKKRDATRILAELRRYTVGDLSRPAQTEQQPVAVPEDFQPLETIRWWISAYTNPENGPSYQGHGMMVQMLCEYEALRIMLSSRAQQRPTAYPHEAMDKLAADRYRVGAAGAGTLHGFAVRAGDGEQELYRGSKSDCEHVARKLAGAFLDGGFTAFERYTAHIAQTAPQPEQSGLVEALERIIAKDWSCEQDATDSDISRLKGEPIWEIKRIARAALSAQGAGDASA